MEEQKEENASPEPEYTLLPGSCYVGGKNGALARMIVSIREADIFYREYGLDDGASICDDRRSIANFHSWIKREASQEEVGKLHMGDGHAQRNATLMAAYDYYARGALSWPDVISDEALLTEVRRRGLYLDQNKQADMEPCSMDDEGANLLAPPAAGARRNGWGYCESGGG